MNLSPDIEQRVKTDGGLFAGEMLDLLHDFAVRHPDLGDRILRSLVFLAEGKPDRLRTSIQRAEQDWRDILVAAEYEPSPDSKPWKGDWIQVRDFSQPFPMPRLSMNT